MPLSRRAFAGFISLFVLIVAFFWLPVFSLYGPAVAGALRQNPASLWSALPLEPLSRALFTNTFLLSVSTAFLSLLFAAPVAAFLARGKAGVGGIVICALPLSIAPTLMATAYLTLSRTPPATAAAALAATQVIHVNTIFVCAPVLALCFYPLCAFAIAAARRAIPPEWLDAARLFGSTTIAARRVLIPLLAPAAWASAGVAAALAMWEMGAPDLLDVRTYSVQIFRNFSADQNLSRAALASLPMFVLGALCFLPAWRALKFYAHWDASTGGNAVSTQRTSRPVIALAWFVFALCPIAPLLVFVKEMGSLHVLAQTWTDNSEEIINTLVLSTIASLAVVFISFVFAALWNGVKPRVAKATVWPILGALLIAPVVMAIAFLHFYNQPLLDGVYDSRYGLLSIGFTARFLPLGILWLMEAVRRVPRQLEEAAAGFGAARWRTWQTVLAPLLMPSLLGLFAVVWALCATELSVAVLLNAPGGQTLPVPIFNQMHIGATAQVAALSLTLVCLTALTMGGVLIGMALFNSKRFKDAI